MPGDHLRCAVGGVGMMETKIDYKIVKEIFAEYLEKKLGKEVKVDCVMEHIGPQIEPYHHYQVVFDLVEDLKDD